MRISTRAEYAVRAMIELGMRNGDGVALKDIARRWSLSLDYLEQIMPPLRKAGLVRSRRGARGGYSLGMPADQITMANIIEIIEGRFEPVGDTNSLSGPGSMVGPSVATQSTIHEVWREVQAAVYSVLDRVRLADLVEKERVKQMSPVKQVYSI